MSRYRLFATVVGFSMGCAQPADGTGSAGSSAADGWCNDRSIYEIKSDSDLADIDGFQRINGTINVGGSTLTTLDLSQVERISGGLYIDDNAALVSVRAPSLLTVSSLRISLNDELVDIDLATLERVDLFMTVQLNPKLAKVEAPLLDTVGGQPTFVGLPKSCDIGTLSDHCP